MKTYTHLTIEERSLIAHCLSDGASISEIARTLRRSKSTVSTEIERNRNIIGYNSVTANRRSLARRQKIRRLDQNKLLQGYMIDRLREGHSPEL